MEINGPLVLSISNGCLLLNQFNKNNKTIIVLGKCAIDEGMGAMAEEGIWSEEISRTKAFGYALIYAVL